MLARMEEADRLTWEGHSRVLEDVVHTLGGIGLGLLIYPALGRRSGYLGVALVALSFLGHAYAFATSPAATELVESRR